MRRRKHSAHPHPRTRAKLVAATPPVQSIVDLDPEDPSQRIDEAGAFQVEEFSVEARSEAEAQADLDAAVAEDTRDTEETEPARPAKPKDRGDLYGVHTPPAGDRELAAAEAEDSFQDSSLGESWLEALQARSGENGPEPERVIDVVDDSDEDHPTHHKTDTRDRPVADKGSGGPGGL